MQFLNDKKYMIKAQGSIFTSRNGKTDIVIFERVADGKLYTTGGAWYDFPGMKRTKEGSITIQPPQGAYYNIIGIYDGVTMEAIREYKKPPQDILDYARQLAS